MDFSFYFLVIIIQYFSDRDLSEMRNRLNLSSNNLLKKGKIMSKKKKKLKKQLKKQAKREQKFLTYVDKTLSTSHYNMLKDLEKIQADLEFTDKVAKKRAKKKSKGDLDAYYEYYNNDKTRLKIREAKMKELGSDDFYGRFMNFIDNIAPIIKLIARLVQAIVVAIMSMTKFKVYANEDQIRKLERTYALAMAFA